MNSEFIIYQFKLIHLCKKCNFIHYIDVLMNLINEIILSISY
jgi:hypothetical protein